MTPNDTSFMAKLQSAAGKLQLGDAAGALDACRLALAARPDDPEARHLEAMALARLGRIDEASASFEIAASRHPRRDAILVNYGNALKRADRLDAAKDAYERATAAAPRSSGAWNALGLALADLGRTDDAISALQQAVATDPRNASALNNLGLALGRAGKGVDAIEAFGAALALNSGMLSARINRAAALRMAGRTEDALKDLHDAVARFPTSAEARRQLAATFRTAGDAAAAIAAYDDALRLSGGDVAVLSEAVKAMWEAGRKDVAFARLDAARMAAARPEYETLRAEFRMRDGDVATARDALDAALRLDPGHAHAYSLRAAIAREAGDLAAALADARRAAELAPDDFETLHATVEIELAADEIEAAIGRLARRAPPDHLQKHAGLSATAYRLAGDDRYKELYDFDRMTAQVDVAPPQGFASIKEFNAALADRIRRLHASRREAPIDQTLYGGTQSVGRLWSEPDPVIQAYVGAMKSAAKAYIAALPEMPDHPFYGRKRADIACAGAWSVILASGGGHVDHIHPAGWISACYYVEAPEEALHAGPAGWLRLGASGVRGVEFAPARHLPPRPGTVIFFPSYMWHGVERHVAQGARITAPFDLSPA